MESEESIFIVIDEVGFGTKKYRNYAYSKIGSPATLLKKKKLKSNLTCTATISPYRVEFIKFMTKGGTTNESFEDYFS